MEAMKNWKLELPGGKTLPEVKNTLRHLTEIFALAIICNNNDTTQL